MSTRISEFLEWATTNGASIHPSVKFEESEQRGIAAIYDPSTKPYNASSEELLKVPESLTLTPQLAESVFGKSLVPKGNRNALTQLLLAKLRFDTAETTTSTSNLSQFFKPYITLLPSGKDIGTPLFWGEERVLISGTDLFFRLDRETRDILEAWHGIITKVPESMRPSNFDEDLSFYSAAKEGKSQHFAAYFNNPINWTSFPAFLWAHATFTSRGFPYFLGSKDARDLNEAILLPVFDLLNHDNETKVKWDFEEGKKEYTFKSEQELVAGKEIYNSYGPKTNEELLLGYGFALENNKEEYATLTLRIAPERVADAQKFGVKITTNQISFKLTKEEPVPENLVLLWCFLTANPDEKVVTLRNKLEGLRQLNLTINQKIEALKPAKASGNFPASVIKAAKTYKNGQKQFFQTTFEAITSMEKALLKQYKPLSFKTIYKADKTFANSLLLIFGIASYEQLTKSDDIDRAVLLWVIRCGNKKHYPADKGALPDWINLRYNDIAKNIVVRKEDVQENMAIYKALFPMVQEKIPEVYGKGDWGIKNFIIAEQVIDEICFTREASKEVFFVENVRL